MFTSANVPAAPATLLMKMSAVDGWECQGTIHIQADSKVLVAGGTDSYIDMVESVIAAHLASVLEPRHDMARPALDLADAPRRHDRDIGQLGKTGGQCPADHPILHDMAEGRPEA